jgi:hypothetical protein
VVKSALSVDTNPSSKHGLEPRRVVAATARRADLTSVVLSGRWMKWICRMLDDLFSLVKRGAPGRIRTCDARFRKPMLYPLSYEGMRDAS